MYSSIRTGESKLACSQSMRSISSRMELTTALNSMPIEPSSRAGFTMTGNCRSCEKSRRPRNDLANTGVWMPWNAKIFFAIALSCASISPWVPEPRVALADQFEKAGDLEVRGVVAGKRLGEVEDQIALDARQRQQALGRAVQFVLHRPRARA